MKKPTQHRSVSEMVRSVSDDQAFADEFTKRLSSRQLIKLLTVLRTRAGLSQQELADKLECTQSKVSKLESSDDAAVRFGDLVEYTKAVDHEMRILLIPKNRTIVTEVQLHASAIKRLLSEMVHLAGDDKALSEGVERFMLEAAFNLGRFVQMAAGALRDAVACPVPLQVEAPDVNSTGSALQSA